MGDFNRGNRSGGNRSFGKPRFNNDRNDRPQMHSATCASCGKQCEVPFRPTGNKPVLCRDCFQSNRNSDSRGSFDRPNFNRDDNRSRQNDAPNYTAQFEALNAKMDKILSLLTQTPATEEVVEEVKEEKKPKRATKKKTATEE